MQRKQQNEMLKVEISYRIKISNLKKCWSTLLYFAMNLNSIRGKLQYLYKYKKK